MRRRPLLLLPILALLCASAPILPAAAADDTLPGGTPITVTIATPPNNSLLPPGPVTITGQASIGTGIPQRDTALMYVIDVSGSTEAGPGCGVNENNDSRIDLLDCEIAGLRALNDQAVAAKTVDKVGLVVLGSRSATADVNPDAPDEAITEPEANRGGVRNIDAVLASAFNRPTPDINTGGVTKFTAQGRDVGAGTIYSESMKTAARAVAQTGRRNKIVVFVSDGNDESESPAVFDEALTDVQEHQPDVVFKTFAVGPASSSVTCGNPTVPGDPPVERSLAKLSLGTHGGLCTRVTDLDKELKLALPAVIASHLNALTLSVDGGAAIPITTVSKTLPIPGPDMVNYSVTTGPLASGTHRLCVRAAGTDSGGPGGVTECHDVTLNTPPVVSAGGPYSGNEDNPVDILGTVADPDTPNPTTTWSIAPEAGVPAGASCVFGNANALSTTVSCTERGRYRLTLTADDHVNPPVVSSTTVTLRNVAPTVSAGGPYGGNEDNDVAIVGVVTDPDGPAPAMAWSIEPGAGVPAGASCVFGNPNVLSTTVNCTERGIYTLTLTVDDHANPPVVATTTLTLTNVKPTVSAGGPYAGEEDHPVAIVGKVTDPDSPGLTTTWKIAANPGVDPAAICSFVDPSKLSTVVTCSEPGSYTLTLTVDDKANPPVVVTTTVTLSQTLGQLSMITSVAPQTGFVGGDPVVVTHTVHNAGPAVMKGVRLTTTIPGGLQVTDVSQAGCAAACELGTLAPGQTVQVRITFGTTTPGDQVVSAAVTTTGPDIDPTDNGGSVRVVIRKPTLTVDPGAGPQGFVPHVTGTDFPPGARVKLQWAIGISETPGEWVVGGDGRLDGWALVFPKDIRGSRTLLATSVAGQRFGPVESTPFLVLPRPLQPMDFVIR